MRLEVITFHLTHSRVEQAKKVLEEAGELLEAVVVYTFKPTQENEDHVFEEALDVIQAVVNLVDLFPSRKSFPDHYARNIEKNERRGYTEHQ